MRLPLIAAIAAFIMVAFLTPVSLSDPTGEKAGIEVSAQKKTPKKAVARRDCGEAGCGVFRGGRIGVQGPFGDRAFRRMYRQR
jgi:hypothetical protein